MIFQLILNMKIKYLIPKDKEEANQYETWSIHSEYEYELFLRAHGAPDEEILTWVKNDVPSEFAIAIEGEDKIKRAKAWFLKSLEEDQIFLRNEIHAYQEHLQVEEKRMNAWVEEMQLDIDKHIPLNV